MKKKEKKKGLSMEALITVAVVDRLLTGTFVLSLCAGVSSGGGEQKRKSTFGLVLC